MVNKTTTMPKIGDTDFDPSTGDGWEFKSNSNTPTGAWTKVSEGKKDFDNYINQKKATLYADTEKTNVLSRFNKGVSEPFLGLAQLVAHTPAAIASGLGTYPNRVSKFLEPETIDKSLLNTETDYQAARRRVGVPVDSYDIARLGGNILGSLPSLAKLPVGKTLVGRIGAGAAAGGAGGATTPVTQEEGQKNFPLAKATQIGVGAAVGAVVNPVLSSLINKAIQGVSWVNKNISPLIKGKEFTDKEADETASKVMSTILKDIGEDANKLSQPQFDALRSQVLEAIKGGKNLDTAALVRKAEFKSLGIEPTAAQVTRNPSDFSQERNLRGIPAGQPLLDRFVQQGEQLKQTVSSFGKKEPNASAKTPFIAGEELTKSLKQTDKSLNKQVSDAYKAARNSSGKEFVIPISGFASDAGKIVKDFRDVIPTPIVERLNEFNILGATGLKQAKPFTFNDANELITLINSRMGNDKPTNTALQQLRISIQKSIEEAPADDVFSVARNLASERFKLHREIPALKNATSNKPVPEEKFVNKYIINGNTKEVQKFANFLQNNHPTQFDEARLQIGKFLKDAAYGENVVGDAPFSAERFAKAISIIGKEKINAFFNSEEITQLMKISRVGSYMNSFPQQSTVNTSNTAGAMYNIMGNMFNAAPIGPQILSRAVPAIQNIRAVNKALNPTIPKVINPKIKRAQEIAATLATQQSARNFLRENQEQ